MKKLILGLDAGSFKVKVAGAFGVDSFKSNISSLVDQKVKERFGEDDMSFDVDGYKGIAGSIAEHENDTGTSSIYGLSKAHIDTKIRVLLAIHRYISKYGLDVETVSIVTGQPIKGHNADETQSIVDMLKGTHKVTVNEDTLTIKIKDVGIAPEGSAAFWSTPQDLEGTIRIVDVGSGTVNACTMKNQLHINTGSDTFNYGMETIRNKELSNVALQIIRSSSELKWDKADKVLVCGGSAGVLTSHIKDFYINAEVLMPTLQVGKQTMVLEPTYANAVGFYQIALGAF